MPSNMIEAIFLCGALQIMTSLLVAIESKAGNLHRTTKAFVRLLKQILVEELDSA